MTKTTKPMTDKKTTTGSLEITSDQLDRSGDDALIINPTEQSTDKKMTFVEWLQDGGGGYYLKCNKEIVELYTDYLINNGTHEGDCTSYSCRLCILERWLSEYHKYFKQ